MGDTRHSMSQQRKGVRQVRLQREPYPPAIWIETVLSVLTCAVAFSWTLWACDSISIGFLCSSTGRPLELKDRKDILSHFPQTEKQPHSLTRRLFASHRVA